MVSLHLSFLLLVLSATGAKSQDNFQEEEEDYVKHLRGLENRRLQVKLDRQPRIIGGSVVNDPNRYPYFALMNGDSLCGAVLVSSRFVLTAAHCAYADNDFLIGGRSYGFKSGRIHPNYNDNDVSNDIAVFELAQDIPSYYATPIKMRRAPVTTGGTTVTVIGFGDTNPSDSISTPSNSLQKVDLRYVPADTCNRAFGRGATSWFGGGNTIEAGMMCAYSEGKDSCGGDSGGPLLIEGSSPSTDELVGIVSWGISCADQDYPGVYTRISYYYDWIANTMCELNSDPYGLPAGVTCTNGNSDGSSSSLPGSGSPTPVTYDDDDDAVSSGSWFSDDDVWSTGTNNSGDDSSIGSSFFEDPLGWLGGLFAP